MECRHCSKWSFFLPGLFHGNVNPQKLSIGDKFWQLTTFPVYPTAHRYRTKLIGPHGGLQVDKQAIDRESRYVEWPILNIYFLYL